MALKPRFALAVDDEPADLESLRRVLTDGGYHVFTAPDAKTAVEIFQSDSDNIEVLVTDVAMAPVNGCELAAELVKLKPDLRVVFVSAYSGSLAFRYRATQLHIDLVAKPFSAEELLAKVR